MLLTRLPLGIATSFDLHVLGTPPALVLSQDQTLHKKFYGVMMYMALKFRCAFSDAIADCIAIILANNDSRIVRSRDCSKTLPVNDLVLRGRRPTDLFAAVLFSFQGANLVAGSHIHASFRSCFSRGAQGQPGYIIAARYPCQARKSTIFARPGNVAGVLARTIRVPQARLRY